MVWSEILSVLRFNWLKWSERLSSEGGGQWRIQTQTGKEMSESSRISTSVFSLRFRLSIYQDFNISYVEMLVCWSCLSVYHCWVLLFTQAVCVCACVYVGYYLWETTQLCHRSNIWISAPTSHRKNRGGPNQGTSHSNLLSLTHANICACINTIMLEILLIWLLIYVGFWKQDCVDISLHREIDDVCSLQAAVKNKD